MCKYCDENGKDLNFLVNNKLGIEDNELILCDSDMYIIRDIKIQYCPMCGRKL